MYSAGRWNYVTALVLIARTDASERPLRSCEALKTA